MAISRRDKGVFHLLFCWLFPGVMLRRVSLFPVLLLLAVGSSTPFDAGAQIEPFIVNVNSRVYGVYSPLQIFLEAGTYHIEPIGVADGGAYNAWNAWSRTTCSDPNGCETTVPTTVVGWSNIYLVHSPDIIAASIEGEDVPVGPDFTYYAVNDGYVYPTDLLALSKARSSTFTLAVAGSVGFSVSDNYVGDNTGGMSLRISCGTNRPPVLYPIGNRLAAAGETVMIEVSAEDPDGDHVGLRASSLPEGALFEDNGDGTGLFSWQTAQDDSGCNPPVTFIVTDDGSPPLSDSEEVTICVGDVNQPPVLDPIGPQTVDSGQLLSFAVTATDPNGDALLLTASDLPLGATFTDNGNGSGDFSWVPAADLVGNYFVAFVVTDSGDPPLSDSETITISVGGVNRPPVLDPVGDQEVDAGDTLRILLTATDPDGDELTVTAGNLPTGATFTDAGDGTAEFLWIPAADLTGNYPVLFTVTDDGEPPASDWESIVITVGGVNRPPYQYRIGNRRVNPDEPLTFHFTASDPEGEALRFTIDDPPQGAVFTSNDLGGWATLAWTPAPAQVGNHRIRVMATDHGVPLASDWEEVTVTVGGINRPPLIDPVGNRLAEVGEQLGILVTARDPDGGALSFYTSDIPEGASLTDNGDGTARLLWTPTAGQLGNHRITFSVVDNGGETDHETAVITVGVVNRPPLLNPIGGRSVNEQEVLWIPVIASDPDGDSLELGALGAPQGAVFLDHNDGTGEFAWTAEGEDGEPIEIIFAATDDGVPTESASETVSISVREVCDPPGVPSGLKVRFTRNYVLLRWTASDDADSYVVYRRVNGLDPFVAIGTTTAMSFRDRDYAMGDDFALLEYYVTGVNECGEGEPSTTVEMRPKGQR